MDFQVIWTNPALDDLKAIVEYIARDNPVAAEKFRLAVFDRTAILKAFPLIGPAYRKRKRGVVREIVHGNYRIFYHVNKNAKQVEILSVWHSAREEPTDL